MYKQFTIMFKMTLTGRLYFIILTFQVEVALHYL